MLVETRAISPIQNRAIIPTRSKDRFGHFKQKDRFRRVHKRASTHSFSGFDSFDEEEPMYDGQCRTILFQLGHIGTFVDVYV